VKVKDVLRGKKTHQDKISLGVVVHDWTYLQQITMWFADFIGSRE